ncbi:Gfo/Idh/MocA family oxidoreductase [bacterium]|nr:Gfo/Idh/MocA family oxidoreductase [bacterium]
MTAPLRLGMIGLDTSHVVAFTEALHAASPPPLLAGARVVVAWPGGSPDFVLSANRVAGFTQKLQNEHGVTMVDSPEAVADQCDAILLESVDGRVHLEQFRRIAPAGQPVFVDKPFALTTADARGIVELARQHQVPLMSCSSLRYAETFTAALADSALGDLFGVDVFGPMSLEPTQPGLFWYGIHTVEMLYTALGRGCREVSTVSTTDHDLVVGRWADGRVGTVRGNRKGNGRFGALLHRAQGTQFADAYASVKTPYVSLLERVIPFCRDRREPIDLEETIEIVRFIEAANESRATGRTVTLG